MMHKLKQKALGEFIALQRGHDLAGSEREEGSIPVFGAAGHNGYHNKAKAKGPGIVIGRSGSGFGNVHICEEDFWPHNTGLYVTDFKGNDPYFTYYFLRNLDFKQYNSGSAQPSLNRNYLYPIQILTPEPTDQKKIAKVLSTLDAKIELNNRINAELEAMAKLLYDYWFVQFDFPMTAAQATALGKPELEGQPYKASGGPMTYNPTLKREIPEGWGDGPLESLCEKKGKSWSSTNHPSEVHYVDLANTKNGVISEIQHFNWQEAPSRARQILEAGDSIIATVRPGNRSFALIPDTGDQLTGSTGFAILRPSSENYKEYVYLTSTSDSNIARLAKIADSATSSYPSIKPEVVRSQPIACPPKDLLERFSDATRSSFKKLENNQKQNQELTALRDWLLPMLMNVQVTVKG